MANEFNCFFSTIGTNLASEIPVRKKGHRQEESSLCEFNYLVDSIILLKQNKTSGVEEINSLFIKACRSETVPFLRKLIDFFGKRDPLLFY